MDGGGQWSARRYLGGAGVNGHAEVDRLHPATAGGDMACRNIPSFHGGS